MSQEISLPEILNKCGHAISIYRAMRPKLLEVYEELLTIDGGPWRVTCKRNIADGAVSFKVGLYELPDAGQARGDALVHDNDPYAPIADVRLINGSGVEASPDTPEHQLQRRIAYFMEEIRAALQVLSQFLPPLETNAPNLGVDPTPLTLLRRKLPPVPFIPVREITHTGQATPQSPINGITSIDMALEVKNPGFSIADRQKIVAEDGPFLDAALVTLDHLLQANWRVATSIATAEKSQRTNALFGQLDFIHHARDAGDFIQDKLGIKIDYWTNARAQLTSLLTKLQQPAYSRKSNQFTSIDDIKHKLTTREAHDGMSAICHSVNPIIDPSDILCWMKRVDELASSPTKDQPTEFQQNASREHPAEKKQGIIKALFAGFVGAGVTGLVCWLYAELFGSHGHLGLHSIFIVAALAGTFACGAYETYKRWKHPYVLCLIVILFTEFSGYVAYRLEADPTQLFSLRDESFYNAPDNGNENLLEGPILILGDPKYICPITNAVYFLMNNESGSPFMIFSYSVETELGDGTWSPVTLLQPEAGTLCMIVDPNPIGRNRAVNFKIGNKDFNVVMRDRMVATGETIGGWIFFNLPVGGNINKLRLVVKDTKGRQWGENFNTKQAASEQGFSPQMTSFILEGPYINIGILPIKMVGGAGYRFPPVATSQPAGRPSTRAN